MLRLDQKLFKKLRRDAMLFRSRIHGIYHWKTVERNGLYLAQFSGADPAVVSHFAFFHDCMRQNEHHDPEHGPRGAKYAKHNRHLIDLNDEQFELFFRACSGHTHGRKTDDPTIASCWDADRLDLGRVGIEPYSKFLITKEAKRIADKSDYQVLVNFYEIELSN